MIKIRFGGGWECLGDVAWQKSEVWAHLERNTNTITDHKFNVSGEAKSGVWAYVFPWRCYQALTHASDGHNSRRAWSTDIGYYELWIYIFLESGFTGICLGSGYRTSTAEVFAP